MIPTEGAREFQCGSARVSVYASPSAAGARAAVRAEELITSAIEKQNRARVIFATGNSQLPLIDALLKSDIDWKRVEIFHMDEYVGLNATHPASFRHWIRTRVEEKVHPAEAHYLVGDAVDLDAEIARYARLLTESPVDLAFVGFGENGHIAFNDPHTANFDDPAIVKRVGLDEISRRQQVKEGHFPDIESVPREALTISCTGLFQAKAWVCCVPEKRKAEAVRNALEGPIAESCPASLVRRHSSASVYLDRDSASLLSV